MSNNREVQKFAGDDVYFWLEPGSSIHLKAVSAQGDPVEITVNEARELASALLKAAQKLDDLDSSKKLSEME